MKTLLEKLGLKPGASGWAWHRPDALSEALPLPAEVPEETTFSIAFVASRDEVPAALAATVPGYRRTGHLWMAYPKKSGGIATDISRDTGWEPLDACDLLPVTQVALDQDWSALRFRYRDEIANMTRKTDRP